MDILQTPPQIREAFPGRGENGRRHATGGRGQRGGPHRKTAMGMEEPVPSESEGRLAGRRAAPRGKRRPFPRVFGKAQASRRAGAASAEAPAMVANMGGTLA